MNEDLGLEHFSRLPDDGVSLEELSRAYAELMRGTREPYEDEGEQPAAPEPASDLPLDPQAAEVDAACPLTPRSILEAILFVGHPENRPVESRQIARLMRGVRPEEIDELVRELNEIYAAERCPYEIRSVGSGYRLELRPEFAPLANKLQGRQKAARLSQAAIDILAIVAYQQPITRDAIDQLRGKPSGAILNQLVRRRLLQVERAVVDGRRVRQFRTTERFLQLFGLESLDELPQSEDMDRF
ncbi:MAG: transcriptional regulator [Pirellulaceae bacterium]|nr:MAG: transcriptional regulator [Pirellulaceae bacterium]